LNVSSTGKREDSFAATATSAGSRVVDLLATKLQLCTATADVSVALLLAPETELVFVEPPEGHHNDDYNDGGFARKSKKQLYELRTAPTSWQDDPAELLLGLGCTRGVFEPTLFNHVERTIYLDTHVDDIHAAGTAADLEGDFEQLAKDLLIKVEPIHDIHSSYEFLRTTTSKAMYILPATQYIDDTAAALGLEKATPSASPGLVCAQSEDDDELLVGDDKKHFSSCVGRLLYLASYRNDIQWVLGKPGSRCRNQCVLHGES
jgi:hypothetical protein